MKWFWKTITPYANSIELDGEYTPFPQDNDLTRPANREWVAYLIPYLYQFICEPPPQIIWAESPEAAVRLVALTAWCRTYSTDCGCTPEKKLEASEEHFGNLPITSTLFPGLKVSSACKQARRWAGDGEEWARRSLVWSLRQSIKDELLSPEGAARWRAAADYLIDQQTSAANAQTIRSAIDWLWQRSNAEQIELLWSLIDWAVDPRQSQSIDRATLSFCTQKYVESFQLLRGLNTPLNDEFNCASELTLRTALECSVFWPLYGTTILSERPCEIDTTSIDSVATLRWSDGFSLYFAGAARISKAIAERHFSWQDIDKERNVEIRRLLIEFYGLDKYLRDSESRVIQRDKFGTLYQKDFVTGDPIVFVQVENKTPEPDGSFKTYLLRVPEFVDTAREGVAWTFGFDDPEEYDPIVES